VLKKILRNFALVLIVFFLSFIFLLSCKNNEKTKGDEVPEMKIQSNSFGNSKMMPAKFTCDSENVSPGLTFSGVPAGSKSLVLIVDDPDAPGGTWVHWTVWNIDPSVTEIPEDSVPEESIEGKTDFGKPGYGGPCPPSGTHRYFFKLYALDTVLDLDASATAADIENSVKGHVLENARLIGLYKRS
jgi:Raf kinase inhibitor-like YbhB/YbcL family protein